MFRYKGEGLISFLDDALACADQKAIYVYEAYFTWGPYLIRPFLLYEAIHVRQNVL